MDLKENLKHIRKRQIKVLTAIILMLSISIGSAFSVSAFNHKYTVIDSDLSVSVVTVDNNPGNVIEKAGFTLNELDMFTVNINDPDDIKIIIHRAFTVETTVDGETKNLSSTCEPVKDLLNRNDINLGENDIVNVQLDEFTSADMKINIDRVELKETKEISEIPFTVSKKKTKELNKGETKIQTPGEKGTKETTKLEKYVNGNLVESQITNETVLKPAVNQCEFVGSKLTVTNTSWPKPSNNTPATNEAGTFTDSNGNVVKYSKVLNGPCTAYTAQKGEHSSTGRPLVYGNVAVDPRKIPYGTRMYICSPDGKFVYGYAIASDTGGAMRSGRVLSDLYYPSEAQCRSFGRRNMTVYILD